jgi:DHA2 family multidrug resistance protein
MERLNLRLASSFAFCVFGFSVLWTATLNEGASFFQFATPRFLQGMGMAFFFLPLNQILMSGITSNELASASGVSNFTRTMAGSFSTAITVWLWNRRSDYHHAVLAEHINNSSHSWSLYQAQLGAHHISGVGAAEFANQVITGQSSTLGVNDVYFLMGLIFLALIPFIWLSKPPFGARAANPAR